MMSPYLQTPPQLYGRSPGQRILGDIRALNRANTFLQSEEGLTLRANQLYWEKRIIRGWSWIFNLSNNFDCWVKSEQYADKIKAGVRKAIAEC